MSRQPSSHRSGIMSWNNLSAVLWVFCERTWPANQDSWKQHVLRVTQSDKHWDKSKDVGLKTHKGLTSTTTFKKTKENKREFISRFSVHCFKYIQTINLWSDNLIIWSFRFDVKSYSCLIRCVSHLLTLTTSQGLTMTVTATAAVFLTH